MEANSSGMIDNIINGLKKAALEIEEFQLQFALGKAEAKDVYEKVKKDFSSYVHNAKLQYENAKDMAEEKSAQLKAAFEELQLQLALGKAETREIFEEQRKKISRSLNEVENYIRKNITGDENYTKLQVEMEKFKIKLDILELRYKLSKLNAAGDFELKKEDFLKKLSEIKQNLEKKQMEAMDKWVHFKDDVTEAYASFMKIFVK